jgi:hypothetical protein
VLRSWSSPSPATHQPLCLCLHSRLAVPASSPDRSEKRLALYYSVFRAPPRSCSGRAPLSSCGRGLSNRHSARVACHEFLLAAWWFDETSSGRRSRRRATDSSSAARVNSTPSVSSRQGSGLGFALFTRVVPAPSRPEPKQYSDPLDTDQVSCD